MPYDLIEVPETLSQFPKPLVALVPASMILCALAILLGIFCLFRRAVLGVPFLPSLVSAAEKDVEDGRLLGWSQKCLELDPTEPHDSLTFDLPQTIRLIDWETVSVVNKSQVNEDFDDLVIDLRHLDLLPRYTK